MKTHIRLFLHNQLHSFDDLLSTPIYLGYWGGVQYGVFLKKISKDSYLYHNFLDDIKKEVSECLYNDDMDRT